MTRNKYPNKSEAPKVINHSSAPLYVVLGTRAQLIKMAPVILELQAQQVPFKFIWTGQHRITISQLLTEFKLPKPDEYWYHGPEPTSVLSLFTWFIKTLIVGLKQIPSLNNNALAVMIVHGDTVSTLLGAILGQLKGYQVAHVEAGLRSFNLLHPFPEELTRIFVFSLSDISFCPGSESCENMSSWGSEIINTNYNTLLDSVNLVPKYNSAASLRDYVLVSLHRYENIFDRHRLRWLMKQILLLSKTKNIKMVLHPTTKKQLAKFGYLYLLAQQPNIQLIPRLSFNPFINLVRNAQFIVTDGGSNQEECYYLGKPCLIMRKTTERSEGLDHNAYLSKYSEQRVRYFLTMYKQFTKVFPTENLVNNKQTSPSEIIVKHLSSLIS